MSGIAPVFGPEGPLSRTLRGFRVRSEQVEMAQRVAEAIATGDQLLVEAGTGVGKTFAYLVPVLLCGGRAIVSTGTRSLQDQLFNRDLPAISGALGRPVDVRMLKGRSNYLCLHRLDLAREQGRLPSREEAGWFNRVAAFARETQTGDVAEVDGVPDDARIWPLVTSTAENCLGQRCPSYHDCHVVAARRRALQADVVVINHHLLLADMVLKEEGFGELLPGADAVVVDEAHQLPEIAVGFFGVSVSARQLEGLARDALAEALDAGVGLGSVEAPADGLGTALARARLALAGRGGRQAWRAAEPDIDESLDELHAAVDVLEAALSPLADSSGGLEMVARRAADLRARLERLADGEEGVRWFESWRRSFALHMTPPDAGEALGGRIAERGGAWVFTSATLAIGDDFSHVAARLGVPEASTLKLDSPFDFPRQGLLYLPPGLPTPGAEDYTERMIDAVRPLIVASGGRAFLLFTSHRALREAAAALRRPGALDAACPLFVQGEAPREQLLAAFRHAGNGVLLGAGSFWEGVDVRGEALSLVVIDRLPFASPGDPLLQARLDLIREAGGNPFMDFQLPQAVLALKQGVGRLIRDHEDRGVAVICDPRLTTRRYGRTFIASLPPMSRTSDLAAAVEFLHSARGGSPI
jgi:ATP-dependent DNA helicase DinG